MKKLTVLILILALMLSLTAMQAAADTPADAAASPEPSPVFTAPDDADAQIALLFDQFCTFMKDDTHTLWSYTVTDLDHNDRLELLSGQIQGDGRFTTIQGWKVNEKKDGVDELDITVADGDSFPDIITDAADVYHDKDNDVWYYMFNDHVAASSKEVYLNKSTITLVEKELKFYTYAYQHVEWQNGRMVVTYTDRDGNALTPEDYNKAEKDVFADTEHSSVHFDWFLAADVEGVGRLGDSYEIFLGAKQPPKPSDPSVSPSPAPAPVPPSTYLVITKNPTDEHRYAGETAWFVAGADNWTSAEWSFFDPYGNECSWQSFQNRFYWCTVGGGNTSSIAISNVSTDMSGWGACCTFYGNGQTLRTTIAYFYVSDKPAPTPTPTPVPTLGPIYGSMGGTVADYLMSTVTLNLDNGSQVQILKDICSISGSLDYGCPATVYYYNYPSSDNIYSCTIQGNPDPPSGSMGATFVGAVMGASNFRLDNGATVSIASNLITNYGSAGYGASATVYYTGYSPSQDNIYHVDVYGNMDDDSDTGTATIIGGDGGVYNPSANNDANAFFLGLQG